MFSLILLATLPISGFGSVQVVSVPGPQLDLHDMSKLVSPASFVVRTERISIPRSASLDGSVPGHALAASLFGEGSLQIPFDVLSSEFSIAYAAERTRKGDATQTSERNVAYIEYRVVQSANRQTMICISDAVHPARVRDDRFELSYFPHNSQLNLDSSPSATVFYSLEQVFQPLPTSVAHATTLESWKQSLHGVGQDIFMTRFEGPDDPAVRYSVIIASGSVDRPEACWLRTSSDDNSLMFSAYNYVNSRPSSGSRWIPTCVLQVQAVGDHLEAERLTIFEFNVNVSDDDARLWIETPRTVLDVRGSPARAIESLSGLPEGTNEMIVIEKPR